MQIHQMHKAEETQHRTLPSSVPSPPTPGLQALENFVTAFVPSDTACLADLPGRERLALVALDQALRLLRKPPRR